MNNEEDWLPSKYVLKKDKLIGSRDTNEVSVSSRFICDQVAKKYQEHLGAYASGKLLDLGCGKAPLYILYKELVTEVVCADWGNSPHVNSHVDDFFDLNMKFPYDSDQFDTIILSDVLEHIRYPERTLSEAYRVLKMNGHLFLNVPFYYPIHEGPFDFFRYTEFALRNMVEKAGFRIVHFSYLGGAPEVFTDLLAKLMHYVPVIGVPVSKITQSTSEVLMRSRQGRKLSQRTAKRFPLGYFMVLNK